MTSSLRNKLRTGNARLIALVATIVVVGVVLLALWKGNSQQPVVGLENAITFTVFRGDFKSSVVESGDMESSQSEEVRCRVKSRGRGGTAILEIVPEGTQVQEGEFLCQLDDSMLRDEWTQQKIQMAKDKAAVIEAENDLQTAKKNLEEYQNGLYQQELDTIQAEKALAEETWRRAKQAYEFSMKLNAKTFVTKTQLEADAFAVENARKELDLARSKLEVFENYTYDRTVQEMEAEIRKQEANLEAAEYTLELSEQREKEYRLQVEACHITAPKDGMVVYANEIDGRGNATVIIEEGVMIRDGQPIIRLPDPSQMQVVTTVNDSKINSIEEGMPAIIRLDTDTDIEIDGRVNRVAAFPLPRRWYQAPIEYEVWVDVLRPDENTRPGLRAKVEIVVEQIRDQVQAPVSSLIRRDEGYFVVVRNDSGVEARPIEISSNNEQFVVVTEGLEPGEDVLVDPDDYLEMVGLGVNRIQAPDDTQEEPEQITKP